MGLDLLACIGFVVKTNHTTRLGPDPYFIHVCGTALPANRLFDPLRLPCADVQVEAHWLRYRAAARQNGRPGRCSGESRWHRTALTTSAKSVAGPADPAAAADSKSDYPSLGAANYGAVLLFFAYVLSFLDRSILSLLVGPIREQFGITDFQYSLLAGAAFALVYSFASLPLGRLADRYSRKLIVAGSVAFWSVATAAGGLANGVAQLFASRMAVGAGEAGLAPRCEPR